MDTTKHISDINSKMTYRIASVITDNQITNQTPLPAVLVLCNHILVDLVYLTANHMTDNATGKGVRTWVDDTPFGELSPNELVGKAAPLLTDPTIDAFNKALLQNLSDVAADWENRIRRMMELPEI